jgi:hypothetical protein
MKSPKLSKSDFIRDHLGRSLTFLVGIAASAGNDSMVDRLLRAKDKLNRRRHNDK